MSDHNTTDKLMLPEHENESSKELFTLSPEQEEEIYNSDLTQCGLGGCRPRWLQKLRSSKSYTLVYGLLGMNQFCLGSFMIATLSTVEKQFKITSRTSGVMSSAWDVGTLASFLVSSYLGGKGHKTKWVALGSIIMSIGCFLRVIPYFVYGAGEEALKFTEEYGAANNISLTQAMDDLVPLCGESYPQVKACDSTDNMFSVIILLISSTVLGIGSSTYWSLGVAYLDDNVRKNKMPVVLAIIACIRMLGPSFGFMAASYCLLFYVNPMLTPTITNRNSQWIGAWWMGWIPMGVINLFFASFMALFPRSLPRAEIRRRLENAGSSAKVKVEISFKDFKATMKRLWLNKIYRYNTLSSVSYMFGTIGYWTYMPKYLESQFQISASEAGVVTGLVGLTCSAMGVLVSGGIVSKFQPRPRYLAAWNVFVEVLDALGHFSFTFMGCPDLNLHGQTNADSSWSTITSCNGMCNCSPLIEYSPVCSVESNLTFFSSCHAGCTNMSIIEGIKTYTNCSCIPNGMATQGACPADCGSHFMWFIFILCLLNFFSATGRAGNTIIQFRCVSPEDKSLSIGITEALGCGLAFIPGPIIYGALLDSSCLVWGQMCDGETGNCWLYTGSHMRSVLNITSSAFILLAAIMDIGVWRNVSHLKMYDDIQLIERSKKSKIKTRMSPDIVEKLKTRDKPRLSIDMILQEEDRMSLRRNSVERI